MKRRKEWGPTIWVPIGSPIGSRNLGPNLGPNLGSPFGSLPDRVPQMGPAIWVPIWVLFGSPNWVPQLGPAIWVPHAQAKLGHRPGRPTVIIQLSLVEIHWIPQGPSAPPPPHAPLAISQSLKKWFFLTDRKVGRNHENQKNNLGPSPIWGG